jgi:hypothetical protein
MSGKRRANSAPRRGGKAGEGAAAGVEALRGEAVREHHLVPVEHEVDVGHRAHTFGDARHAAPHTGELDRAGEGFAAVRPPHEHTVLRRDEEGAVVAERARRDAHGAEGGGCGKLLRPEAAHGDPAERAGAVVPGEDEVPGPEAFHRGFSEWGADQGAGGEAGDARGPCAA